MNDRLIKIKDVIKKKNCNGILITDPIDATYISGFPAEDYCLFIDQRRNYLCTDSRFQEAALKFCEKSGEWNFILIKKSGFLFLKHKFKDGYKIAFQSEIMPVAEYNLIKKEFPKIKFIPTTGIVADTTVIKNSKEIKFIEEACRIADRAFKQFCWAITYGAYPKLTEKDAAGILERICSEIGSEKQAFDTILLFGSNSSVPHGVPSSRILSPGELILVDFGCTVSGFRSDMTRTFVVGEPSRKQKEIYSIVKEAHDMALQAVKSGMRAKEIDNIAMSIIEKAGYKKFFTHSLGHGVGLRIHERPWVSPSSTEFLQPGNIITIEPGIYIPGWGGIRIEDTVVIEKKKARSLSLSPYGLNPFSTF